jgi:hypothetical protein
MPSATMRRCCLIAGRDKPCALQSRRPSSPESHPNASVLRGSAASCLVSECPHFEHSNARLSKPFASSETEIVVIRIWHLGQRGRWIGNNSGSGFRMAFALEQAGALHSHSPMMAPDRAVIRNAISDFAILSVRFPTLGRELRHSQEFQRSSWPGFVPAIHVFSAVRFGRRGYPRHARASSTPQPRGSIIDVGDYWIIRFRG